MYKNNNDSNDEESIDVYKHIKSRRAKRRKKVKTIKLTALSILLLTIIATSIIKINILSGAEKEENVKLASDDSDVKSSEQDDVSAEIKEETITYPNISATYSEITSPSVRSPYIAVLDVENNEIIAGRNKDARIYPASMTKVMTLIVAVENLKSLDDTFSLTSEMLDPLVRSDASRAGFEAGEIVSAKNLLYGLVLPSGADAAVALANMIAGSEEEFVKLMNEKCEKLGLTNTHFMNASGLHDENQYTTPVEMAIILEYAMKNETCSQILSTYQYTTDATLQHPEGILLTSTMFSRMYGNEVEGVTITSGKTGYTAEAKHCMVSYAVKDGRHFVALTAGAESKWYTVYDDFELYKDYACLNN